jgi:hypothetical protein
VSTGEDWPKIMFDTNNTDGDCIEGETCGTVIAPLYFISFIVIVSFVMLNLFILVIIQQFDQYYLSDDNVLAKFEKDLYIFKNSWTKFAKSNKCIKVKDNKLVAFFKSMEKPLGMTAEDLKDNNDIHKNIVQMDIRADEEGYVYFNELLYKVMKKTYGIKHIRNKKLADYEANTFIKINKIQEKMSNYLIREDKKATAVNPFLAIMYYNISFKTWLNLARKRMELEAVNDNLAGSEQSNEDFSDIMLDPEEISNKSEGSFHTFRVESVASSSANFSQKSKEISSSKSESSRIETITEHELEDNDKEYPDASIEERKEKRLFGDDGDDEDDEDNSDSSEEPNTGKMFPINIQETDERKEEDIYSDGGKNKQSRGSSRYKDTRLDKSFEKRKSSCPEQNPYNLPQLSKNDKDLNIIDENKNEQTFSIDRE